VTLCCYVGNKAIRCKILAVQCVEGSIIIVCYYSYDDQSRVYCNDFTILFYYIISGSIITIITNVSMSIIIDIIMQILLSNC